MSPDARFAWAIAVMAAVTLGCRLAGFAIGERLSATPRLRRFLDLLPAAAIGAVLGPAAAHATALEWAALGAAAAVYGLSARLLPAFLAGSAVLLAGPAIAALAGTP